MKIEYLGFRSLAQEDEIKSLLDELGDLIPKKVLDLSVRNWDHNGDEGITASISYNEAYLRADLNIYNKFFANDEEKKREIIIHELCHLHTAEFFHFVDNDMIQYVHEQNEPLAEQFRRITERAEEVMVTQIARFIVESTRGNKRN